MEHQVVILPSADKDLDSLAPEVRTAVLKRMRWLGLNAEEIVHHRLQNLPAELDGLCRLRQGDYRILYWRTPAERMIKVYRVRHRSEVYRDL